MSNFQRLVLAILTASFGQRRRILREVQAWSLSETPATYRARLRGWPSIIAFVVITTAIEQPVYMMAGPPVALLLYAVGFVQLVRHWTGG